MKTPKLTILLLLMIPLLYSCKKEDTEAPGSLGFDTPVISGYWMRDYNGSPMGYIGIPNIKTSTADGLEMHCFPNPACDYLKVYFDNNNTLVKKIWIVRASGDPNVNLPDYTLNAVIEHTGGSPLFLAITSQSNINIDISNLPNGYYRVYCQMGDELLYDNLVHDNSMFYCGDN